MNNGTLEKTPPVVAQIFTVTVLILFVFQKHLLELCVTEMHSNADLIACAYTEVECSFSVLLAETLKLVLWCLACSTTRVANAMAANGKTIASATLPDFTLCVSRTL